MTTDPYLLPGTRTLRNLGGFRNPDELAQFEVRASFARIYQLERGHPLPGRWDLAHLCRVHGFLFQDVYDWAGRVRTVAMSKGADFHPLPQPAYADAMFDRLAAAHQLRGLDRARFLTGIAQLESELFALHPFREGNTRSTTTFVSMLARHAGWHLDWGECDPHAMQEALRRSFRAPERQAGRELEPLIDGILTPLPLRSNRPAARSQQSRRIGHTRGLSIGR